MHDAGGGLARSVIPLLLLLAAAATATADELTITNVSCNATSSRLVVKFAANTITHQEVQT